MVAYQDYYQTLGVARNATQDQIQKSFRKLARKYHPDVNKEKGAEEKFKVMNEAYEVLKDPEKRKLYDSLGANWKAGQDFRPPPGFEEVFRQRTGGPGGQSRSAGPQGMHFEFGGGGGGFSDFFSSIFGGGDLSSLFGGAQHSEHLRRPQKGQSMSADLTLTIYDLLHAGTKQVSLEFMEETPDGRMTRRPKTYSVRIPPGTRDGSVIRLAGQGAAGYSGSEPGDLLFNVKVLPDAKFKAENYDLVTQLPISAWEAALGSKIEYQILDGAVKINIPAGSQSGQRLRLKGKGLPKSKQELGDLYVELVVQVPKSLTEREIELFQSLAKESRFNPRV